MASIIHSEDELADLAAALAPHLLNELSSGALERDSRLQVGVEPSPHMTIAEAAELMRCSRQRVYDLVSQGKLRRAARDGRRVLLAREEVEAYLTEQAG